MSTEKKGATAVAEQKIFRSIVYCSIIRLTYIYFCCKKTLSNCIIVLQFLIFEYFLSVFGTLNFESCQRQKIEDIKERSPKKGFFF